MSLELSFMLKSVLSLGKGHHTQSTHECRLKNAGEQTSHSLVQTVNIRLHNQWVLCKYGFIK